MPHGLLVAAFARNVLRIPAVFRRRSRPTRSVFTFLGHARRMKTLTHARISLRQLLKPSGKTCFISPERGSRRCPVRPQYILNPVKRALAARGESLAAFDERCIPASGVAP